MYINQKIDRRANLDHKSQYQMEILNLGILMMKLMRCYFTPFNISNADFQ